MSIVAISGGPLRPGISSPSGAFACFRCCGWWSSVLGAAVAAFGSRIPAGRRLLGGALGLMVALLWLGERLAIAAIVPVVVALALHHRFERPVSRWLRARLLRSPRAAVVG